MDNALVRSVCPSARAWTTDMSTELVFNGFHCASLRDLVPWRFSVSDLSCDVGGGGGDDDDKASRSSSDLNVVVGFFGGSAALSADPSEHSLMQNRWLLAHRMQCARPCLQDVAHLGKDPTQSVAVVPSVSHWRPLDRLRASLVGRSVWEVERAHYQDNHACSRFIHCMQWYCFFRTRLLAW